MNSEAYVGSDAQRTRLRAIVAAIDHEMSHLPTPAVTSDVGNTPPDVLHASWADLVGVLALGPEPKMRQCPICAHIIRRAATRCRSCWTKLPLLDDPDDVVA